ncbi:protein phosphatase 1 regulatory subunit 37 [Trichonephila clavipes]|nr:protein phosphatase 1 regulatory subunit 37 [Trichonephila clavipes]
MTEKYVWSDIKKQVREWAKACIRCQKCKVSRHTKSKLGDFEQPDERFSVVHIDLIGKLPPSEGMQYCLTCIDRFSCWMEAIPIPEITAEIVGRAFYEKWICRFGVPAKIVTDQGRQFEAELFRSIAAICGAKVAHTTSYHPQCNGKVERLHRTLKGAIKAHNNIRWTESLPTVLLGLRAAIRPDISYTIAQMVYDRLKPAYLLAVDNQNEQTSVGQKNEISNWKELSPMPDEQSTTSCGRKIKKPTTSLVNLNARSTGLNEQVLLIIGRALRLGSNLVTLHLENCGIFGRCLVILVAALKQNTTMRELFLAENKISSADGFQLGNLLRTNTHLELLDLSNNKLGDEGLTHVMDSLGQQSNTSGRGLYTLILWNNELTVKGMPCVSRALTAARALRRLNLGSNAITSAGILELKQSFICNRTIEILELENAKITSEGAIALAEYLSQNQLIQKLDIRGNDIRLDGLTALSQAVMKNSNVTSLKVDPTSMDLSEPIKERQERLQEISKCCQKNKEAKSSLPPQDAQLSFLFNGIFSHVLPTTLPGDVSPKSDSSEKSKRGRFHVSVVVQDNTVPLTKPALDVSRSLSLDPSYCSFGTTALSQDLVGQMASGGLWNQPVKVSDSDGLMDKAVKNNSSEGLVLDRVKWLEGLEMANEEVCAICSCKEIDNSEVFLPGDVAEGQPLKKEGLSLSLNQVFGETSDGEPKVRRSSSPTISSTPKVCRKTHRIKCCKELESLDLRSTVPLSPTRLHETFDFQDPQVTEVPLNSQMNMKSSHAVYMVH